MENTITACDRNAGSHGDLGGLLQSLRIARAIQLHPGNVQARARRGVVGDAEIVGAPRTGRIDRTDLPACLAIRRGGCVRPAVTRAVIAKVQADGTCWCGGTEWHGHAAMCISVSSWATTEEDVEMSLAAIRRIAEECRR